MIRRKKTRKQKFITAALAVLVLVTATPSVSYAATSTQTQIKETENEKKDVNDKKKQNKKELEALKEKQKQLKDKLANLNLQLTDLSEKLDALDEQIRVKEAEIAETVLALEEARELEAWQYDCMTKRIQLSYEIGNKGLLQSLLSISGFGKFLNSAPYQQGVAAYDDEQLDSMIENREFIESEEIRLHEEKIELDELLAKTEEEKSKVNRLISETGSDIAQYSDLISDAEAEALEYEKQLKQLDEDLTALKKKLKEEQALSQKAANGVWRSIGDVKFADGDRKLLANLIYCEAGAESYEGQVAVGAVVMNRILSGCFPDTMVGVIYQKGQFSPAKSGRLELALATDKASSSCYKAADEAMAGTTNVGNCVHFRTPVKGLTGITIGGHVFY